MELLAFAGSLRADSVNKKLAREALRLAAELGAEVEFVDLKDYPMPLYDGDIEGATGLPEATVRLGEKIAAADALVVANPEYNGSISGALKNTIDWLSREKRMSLGGKHLLLLAASPGALGGIRGLWHSRQPFEALGVHVFHGMVGLPHAYQAFDEQGKLTDEKTATNLTKTLQAFLAHAGRN